MGQKEPPEKAVDLNRSGLGAWNAGDYRAATEQFTQALELLDQSKPEHAELRAVVLNNMALVASARGDHPEAKDLLQESLRAAEPIGGLTGRSLAITLDNLAAAEIELAKLVGPYWINDELVNGVAGEHLFEAERYLDDAQGIFYPALPESRDDLLVSLGHSRYVKWAMREYEAALGISDEMRRVLWLNDKADINEIWDVSQTHAQIQIEMGEADSACDTLRRLVEIDTERPLVTPSGAAGLTTAARAFALIGERDNVEYCARRVVENDELLMRDRLAGASEEAARHHYQGVYRRTQAVLGAHLLCEDGGELEEWALKLLLNRKGVLAYRLARLWAQARDDPANADLLAEVRSLRRKVVEYDLGSHDEKTIRSARQRHLGLSQQRNKAEAALFSAVEPFVPDASVDDLYVSLGGSDAVFVDLAVVSSPGGLQSQKYVAVLFGPTIRPRYLVLGSVSELDKVADDLVKELSERPAADASPEALNGREASIKRKIERLSAWSRVKDLPQQVVVAPSGLWARVPLALLRDENGDPLIDHHVVHTVPSSRWWVDHVFDRTQPMRATTSAVVVGDVDFDRGLPDAAKSLDYLLRMRIDRLEHSGFEARAVAARLECPMVPGDSATRDRLLAVKNPSVLHLATHGLFITALASFEEQREPREKRMEMAGGVVVTRPPDIAVDDNLPAMTPKERHRQRRWWLQTVGPSDPLSRSALILAGFNAWVAGVSDDLGVLSAAEVALMDLRGTELVVLSACRSGASATDYADGSAIGIRTACLIAGASACIASLWNVPDARTAEFMDELYGELLAGTGRAEALRRCQLARRHEDPYYWASWTLEGGPEPLRRDPECV